MIGGLIFLAKIVSKLTFTLELSIPTAIHTSMDKVLIIYGYGIPYPYPYGRSELSIYGYMDTFLEKRCSSLGEP
jgi:hypothetical protein